MVNRWLACFLKVRKVNYKFCFVALRRLSKCLARIVRDRKGLSSGTLGCQFFFFEVNSTSKRLRLSISYLLCTSEKCFPLYQKIRKHHTLFTDHRFCWTIFTNCTNNTLTAVNLIEQPTIHAVLPLQNFGLANMPPCHAELENIFG